MDAASTSVSVSVSVSDWGKGSGASSEGWWVAVNECGDGECEQSDDHWVVKSKGRLTRMIPIDSRVLGVQMCMSTSLPSPINSTRTARTSGRNRRPRKIRNSSLRIVLQLNIRSRRRSRSRVEYLLC
jgi:hypothetical protein